MVLVHVWDRPKPMKRALEEKKEEIRQEWQRVVAIITKPILLRALATLESPEFNTDDEGKYLIWDLPCPLSVATWMSDLEFLQLAFSRYGL